MIIVNERHLRRILQNCCHYYNTINKDSPEPREVQTIGQIDKVAVVNGLHHSVRTSLFFNRQLLFTLLRKGYCERIIGSIRKECLDHLIIMKEGGHLPGILESYIGYYNSQRTHLGVNKDSPEPREVQADVEIDRVDVVNGLHHHYFRRAA